MKTIQAAALILTMIGLFSCPQPAAASVNIGFSLDFHDALSPYGTWVHISSCPDCWRPAASGFVPFTEGHWAYTSYGPTWVGSEPWAWAPYHYGHWVYTVQYGWIWSPGYEWSPGQVTWCYGDDYIGWSPVYGASPSNTNLWVVVHRDNFGSPNYAPVRVRRDTVNVLFERRTVRVSSSPLQRVQVERIVRHPIAVETVREREIEVNNHRTRMIVTKDREDEVVKHVAEAAERHRSAASSPAPHETTTVSPGKPGGKDVHEQQAQKDSKHDSKKDSKKGKKNDGKPHQDKPDKH